MQNWSVIGLLVTASICGAVAAPTLDVLYKIARNLENELIGDSYDQRREPYRPQQPGYRVQPLPSGNGYYPPPPAYRGPQPYGPEQYPPYNNGAYPGQQGYNQYPQAGYGPTLGNPYEEEYPLPMPNSGYGTANDLNSYQYGGNGGYKNRGY